ncbi:sensor histidine kinase [candidate division WWE3 bacterium]|jgi:signal transduction histidine kinase|uniref:histidine kinase n=1 Tax=candidate division WWE3 bacterium TaxID=2053526 RepID=A0A3A4ZAS2_UNCKA|nr:MAG: sensor histidine kinase [candidate division WWE3 bacterium]
MPNNKLNPDTLNTLEALWKLEKIILDSLDFHDVVQKVVDAILTELGYLDLGYKVVVLALVDEERQVLKRVSLSSTLEAQKTREVSELPFELIVIPLTEKNNLCIKALQEGTVQITHYFPDILTPPISPENALASQKNAGIITSMVYPLKIRGKTIGVMIFSMNKAEDAVSDQEKALLRYFTDLVAMAVQNSRLYSNLENERSQLKFLNDRLEQLDKLKDDFLSVASHELRTPMTIIKSYLWMLNSGKAGELLPKQKEYLYKAVSSTERMIALINDMLNVSRMEQGRVVFDIKRLDIVDLLKETLSDFKLKAEEKGIYLEICCEDKQIFAYTDSGKLTEIITNLVGNSLKFTRSGGIKVQIEEDENNVKVSVIDTGAGISEEDQKRLFHKFGRLDNSYQTVAESGGTGLGLYIVKLYVEGMKGTVRAYSEGINMGSTFTFTLPKELKTN